MPVYEVKLIVVVPPLQIVEAVAVAVPPAEVGETVTVDVLEVADAHTPLVTMAR